MKSGQKWQFHMIGHHSSSSSDEGMGPGTVLGSDLSVGMSDSKSLSH